MIVSVVTYRYNDEDRNIHSVWSEFDLALAAAEKFQRRHPDADVNIRKLIVDDVEADDEM